MCLVCYSLTWYEIIPKSKRLIGVYGVRPVLNGPGSLKGSGVYVFFRVLLSSSFVRRLANWFLMYRNKFRTLIRRN